MIEQQYILLQTYWDPIIAYKSLQYYMKDQVRSSPIQKHQIEN